MLGRIKETIVVREDGKISVLRPSVADQTLKKDAGKPVLELTSGVLVNVWKRWLQLEGWSDQVLREELLEQIHAFADGSTDTSTLNRAMAAAARLLGGDDFYEALTQLAAVLEFGAKKYSRDGWRVGMAWRRLIGAALRHAYQAVGPNPNDAETGLPHLAHFLCCCMFLEEYRVIGNGIDDRWKRA